MRSFSIKFLVLGRGGGISGVFWGGGVPILFLWARGFSEFRKRAEHCFESAVLSRFWGRGCDEALSRKNRFFFFAEKEGDNSVH